MTNNNLVLGIERHTPLSMVYIVAHVIFALIILVSSFYQLSNTIKYMTPIACLTLTIMGVSLNRKTGKYLAYSFVFYVFCLAGLSAAGFMNDAWTELRTDRALLRQLSVHAFVPLTAFGFAVLLSVIGKNMKQLAMIFLLPISIISIFVYTYTAQAGMTDKALIINNLYSFEVFRVFFIGVLILSIRSHILFFLAFYCLYFFAFSLQAQLCLIVMLLARFLPVYRWMILAGYILIACISLYSTTHWQALLEFDNNIGVRALFWKDALSALYQTNYLGVGYGTESIIPYYPSGGTIRYFGSKIPSEYISIGVHSSFFQQLFNSGIAGTGLLFSWIFCCIWGLRPSRVRLEPIDILACGMLCISVFSNMAFDSYNFIIGSTFLLGWIIYRGNEYRKRDERSPDIKS